MTCVQWYEVAEASGSGSKLQQCLFLFVGMFDHDPAITKPAKYDRICLRFHLWDAFCWPAVASNQIDECAKHTESDPWTIRKLVNFGQQVEKIFFDIRHQHVIR